MFFKEVNEIDLGETTIANIFIDIFLYSKYQSFW